MLLTHSTEQLEGVKACSFIQKKSIHRVNINPVILKWQMGRLNVSTILSKRRSIYTLNEYIPDHLRFSISHHEIRTNMTYADFSALCQRLDMNDYSPSLEERLSLIVCFGLLDGIVNMTELYARLNLSLSTKKKDRKELGFLLQQNGIEVVNRHRKGVSFEGNERFLRMIAARNLLSVIELNKNDDYVPQLYEQVKRTVSTWATDDGCELTDHQMSVICLILERFIIKNRVAGQNNRRVVIITNSSVEKVSFFLEVLSQHVNYEMVSYLTINELYRLEEMKFDAILTFSNRITVLLSELGWESIKINFYLTSDDIKRLLDHGFTSSRNKKLLAEEVVRQLETRSDTQDRTTYLQTAFPDIMI